RWIACPLDCGKHLSIVHLVDLRGSSTHLDCRRLDAKHYDDCQRNTPPHGCGEYDGSIHHDDNKCSLDQPFNQARPCKVAFWTRPPPDGIGEPQGDEAVIDVQSLAKAPPHFVGCALSNVLIGGLLTPTMGDRECQRQVNDQCGQSTCPYPAR